VLEKDSRGIQQCLRREHRRDIPKRKRGYDVEKFKLLAFVLPAATKTVVLGFETLTDVHWTMSGWWC
jgi:hypothetical protein